jgi:hypothetical protein
LAAAFPYKTKTMTNTLRKTLRTTTLLTTLLLFCSLSAFAADKPNFRVIERQRDLSPSIETQRIFSRQRPQDKNDYVIEIKAGGAQELTLEVFSR